MTITLELQFQASKMNFTRSQLRSRSLMTLTMTINSHLIVCVCVSFDMHFFKLLQMLSVDLVEHLSAHLAASHALLLRHVSCFSHPPCVVIQGFCTHSVVSGF